MREIKFRAWDDATKEMHRPEDRRNDTILSASANILKHYGCVMQFTGLLDKNGKEIYEGDILKYETPYEPYFKNHSVVYSTDEKCGLTNEHYLGAYMLKCKDGFKELICNVTRPHRYAEVIGNIYENPELLKS